MEDFCILGSMQISCMRVYVFITAYRTAATIAELNEQFIRRRKGHPHFRYGQIGGGDTRVGGEDFEIDWSAILCSDFKRNIKSTYPQMHHARVLRKLGSVCEGSKRELSSCVKAILEVQCFQENQDFHSKIRRA